MSTNNYNIYWKGVEIGQFVEESMDMAYLDGKLMCNNSKYSEMFVRIASKLDPESVIRDYKKGIRATMEDESGFLFNVLVLGLTEKMELILKMVLGKQETIDWLLENVPEE